MKKNTLKIDTVHQCNHCLGSVTLHPLVSVIDLSKANLMDTTIKFNFYTILLVENECTDFDYGRKYYDYSNATLIFLPPGHSLQMDAKKPFPKNAWLLAFHPHLIHGTTLGSNIDKYTFFSYQINESLHLSLREKMKVLDFLAHIDQEVRYSIDRYSQTIISRYIELFLDYCSRYYERQFITRNEANIKILDKTDLLLDEYIKSGNLENKRLPSTEYCSDILHLSPCYFSDLLRIETGKTLHEYFQLKRLEIAKTMLLAGNKNVKQIVELLGFPSVHYFSKVFKSLTGIMPEEYKSSQN